MGQLPEIKLMMMTMMIHSCLIEMPSYVRMRR